MEILLRLEKLKYGQSTPKETIDNIQKDGKRPDCQRCDWGNIIDGKCDVCILETK